jgi:hypothetical protein
MAERAPFGTGGFAVRRVFEAPRVEQRGHLDPDEYHRAQSGWGAFFARIDERLADGSQPGS